MIIKLKKLLLIALLIFSISVSFSFLPKLNSCGAWADCGAWCETFGDCQGNELCFADEYSATCICGDTAATFECQL
jgi:hypothetical protein